MPAQLTPADVADWLLGSSAPHPPDRDRRADREPRSAGAPSSAPSPACTAARCASGWARCAAARPSALLETGETSLRAEQRIEALASVLRSIVTFVVYTRRGPDVPRRGRDRPRPAARRRRGARRRDRLRLPVAGRATSCRAPSSSSRTSSASATSSTSTTRSGTVEAVSLRTTRLRAIDGTVWHMPNGEIRRVGNMASTGRARCSTSRSPTTPTSSTPRASSSASPTSSANDDGRRARRARGVGRRGSSARNGVALRLVVKTTPSEQWRVSRRLRERIKAAFDEEGIEIPFPQQTVWHRPRRPVRPGSAPSRRPRRKPGRPRRAACARAPRDPGPRRGSAGPASAPARAARRPRAAGRP